MILGNMIFTEQVCEESLEGWIMSSSSCSSPSTKTTIDDLPDQYYTKRAGVAKLSGCYQPIVLHQRDGKATAAAEVFSSEQLYCNVIRKSMEHFKPFDCT